MPQINVNTELKQDWDCWNETRDSIACDRLVRAYMPLVDYHVNRISSTLPRNVHVDDLKSNGMLGLLDALEKFDPKRDLKFDTYASFRIRGAIIDGLRQQDWLPRSVREKTKKIEQTVEKLEQEYGRYVTSEEVAASLGIGEDEVLRTMNENFIGNHLSIDETANDDNDVTFSATIMDNKQLTPEARLNKKADMEELTKVIQSLNEKEQLIISLFYFEELTLTEIGHIMNLTTSRISQIHSKTIFKLQSRLQSMKETD
ncbi:MULTISPECIES: FliA/WhiG family RNA polymerase sigma factor [Bacillaceae]|uniref:FliA/WhiG family RNA polymerase sigma factor n=1 Tax=Evansella alkalicola TaxID=745819 RepID=A0ABS6JRK6_9BACI|nr:MULTISPECIES: FliA/WhiG family RNA polymerase sigma factor [Bacillaceae]MBU9720344.1 FliA/WhiG family RNA polymerase sigma factor [Bacillus alkalicola]